MFDHIVVCPAKSRGSQKDALRLDPVPLIALLPKHGPGRRVRSVLATWSPTSRRRGTRPDGGYLVPKEVRMGDGRHAAGQGESLCLAPARCDTLRGRDPSADPGAKTGVGGGMPPLRISGIGHKAINPLKVFVMLDDRRGARALRWPRPSC